MNIKGAAALTKAMETAFSKVSAEELEGIMFDDFREIHAGRAETANYGFHPLRPGNLCE